MAESSSTFDAGFDLSQFHAVFYEEAAENLETMERLLLAIDLETTDEEELNAIFRCAHSVKGGAATFGFGDIAELTHEMETLLDRLRRLELRASPRMVDVLLESGDGILKRAQAALQPLLARLLPSLVFGQRAFQFEHSFAQFAVFFLEIKIVLHDDAHDLAHRGLAVEHGLLTVGNGAEDVAERVGE